MCFFLIKQYNHIYIRMFWFYLHIGVFVEHRTPKYYCFYKIIILCNLFKYWSNIFKRYLSNPFFCFIGFFHQPFEFFIHFLFIFPEYDYIVTTGFITMVWIWSLRCVPYNNSFFIKLFSFLFGFKINRRLYVKDWGSIFLSKMKLIISINLLYNDYIILIKYLFYHSFMLRDY